MKLGLLVKLEELIGMKLEYKEIKKRYTSWYDNSLPSMYEFLKQIPYIQKRVGIAVTMDFIKKRMFKKR